MEAGAKILVLLSLLFATPTTAPSAGDQVATWSKPQKFHVSGKTVTIRTVRFAGDVTSEKAVAAMVKRSAAPASDEHCSAYVALTDGLFVCLGSVKVLDGQRFVRVWYANRGLEEKELNPWEGHWPRNIEFLAVQK